jgi:hypothetical protein
MSAIKVILIFKKDLNLAWLVVLHDEFERPQEVLLEVEVLQLALLQKLQRQLPEVLKTWRLRFPHLCVKSLKEYRETITHCSPPLPPHPIPCLLERTFKKFAQAGEQTHLFYIILYLSYRGSPHFLKGLTNKGKLRLSKVRVNKLPNMITPMAPGVYFIKLFWHNLPF